MNRRDASLALGSLGIGLLSFLAVSAPASNGIEALLAARLTGMDKPGTTQAGPAILELSNLWGASFWIKVYLPPLTELRGAQPVIAIARVLDGKGVNLYDPGHQLETEFFQRLSLITWSSPVPSLQATRTVNLKAGQSTSDLQKVEGTVKLSLPLNPLAVTFGAADVGKERKVHRRVIRLESFNPKEAEIRLQGDSPLVAVIGYGADGNPVQTGMRPGSTGGPKITFQAPAKRMEMVFAESLVERQFPFALTRTSVAGATAKATEPAKSAPAK
jgi:hypothetical protein